MDFKKLDGCIVQIESKRYGGHFIDSHHSRVAKCTGCSPSYRQAANWSKWKIRSRGGDDVSFESVRFPDHFLDMNTDKDEGNRHVQRITKSMTGQPESWGIFRIHGDLSNCMIQSMRWNDRWLDCHDTKKLLGTSSSNPPSGQPWASWQIAPPAEIHDSWEEVNAVSNDGDTVTMKATFTYTKGISNTSSSSFQFGMEQSIEVEANFEIPAFTSGSVKVGAKFSQNWENSSSETFTQGRELSLEVECPPKTKIILEQLIGTYGIWKVRGEYRIRDISLA